MPVPETTSVEAFARYVGGKVVRVGHGKAWREIQAFTMVLPRVVDLLPLPSVGEPFLAWTMSGEVEFQEREGNRPWITHRLKKNSFLLTSGGAPYDCRWKAMNSEPFQSMAVFLELPLLERALNEVFGNDAGDARLRDASAFTDDISKVLMAQLHGELMRIGEFGPAPKPLAPLLLPYLESENFGLRMASGRALRSISPESLPQVKEKDELRFL